MKTSLASMFMSFFATTLLAEPLSIIGFDTGQGFAFQGATVSNFYTLEFAPTANGPWTNWGSVSDQPVTGSVMASPSPLFYRISQTDSSAFPPYAPATNIPGSMITDGSVTGIKIANGAVSAYNLDSTVSNLFVLKLGDSMNGALALPEGGLTVGHTQLLVTSQGNVISTGSITALAFLGNGAGLTGLNGGNINPGSISTAALADTIVTSNKLAANIGLWIRSGTNISFVDGDVGIRNSNPSTALAVSGTITADKYVGDGSGLTNTVTASHFVFAFDTTTQYVSTAYVFQDVTFSSNRVISGWTHTNGSAAFICRQTGLYHIQYTAYMDGVNGCTGTLLAMLNGVEIEGSQLTGVCPNGDDTCVSRSLLTNISSNDLLKFRFSANQTVCRLFAGGAANGYLGNVRPSISCTIVRIR